MPTDRVDFPIVPTTKVRTPTMHHNGRINKVVTRMNITSNPLATDGEKVQKIVALFGMLNSNLNKLCSFSPYQQPNSGEDTCNKLKQPNNNCGETPTGSLGRQPRRGTSEHPPPSHSITGLPPKADYSNGDLIHAFKRSGTRVHVDSPLAIRNGISMDVLPCRSPFPLPVAKSGSYRHENISLGSLNSITV